jgi:hypothetical protein
MEPFNQSVIIEFNGLPGCGKSTTATLLMERLKLMGYEVGYFEDLQNCKYSNRRMKNIKLVLNSLKPPYIKVIYNLLKVWLNLKPFKFSRINYIKLVYNFYFIYFSKEVTKRYDFIICDQGLIQGILSIMHTDIIKDNSYIQELVDSILYNLKDIYWVNCNVNYRTAKERIRSRGLTQGRLDFINDDNRLFSALLKQELALDLIRKEAEDIGLEKTIQLDMNCVVEKNIEFIIKKIKLD